MAILTTGTAPLTLLEAVNEMLAAVGRGPVSSTDPVAMGEEAGKALNIISNVSVQVQSSGWNFNSEVEYPLIPSADDGTIELPLNTLTVAPCFQFLPKKTRPSYDRNRTFTMRGYNNGLYLYDVANQTFIWSNTNTAGNTTPDPLIAGTIPVDMVMAYPFEQLPQHMRWLIMATAGNIFGVGRVPDMQTFRFTQAVVDKADSDARQADQEASGSFTDINPHFAMMRRR